jgi:ADP-ribosylglycohydrolase
MNSTMAQSTLETRLEGGLVEMLVGDTLGVPYEFKHRHEIPAPELIEMDPRAGFHRSHRGVPPGTRSDDGAQGLCFLDSLLHSGELDLEDFGTRLLRWLDIGYLTPDSHVFNCGIQTRESLMRMRQGTPPASRAS